jgi:hypothetical protein
VAASMPAHPTSDRAVEATIARIVAQNTHHASR